MIKPAMGSFAPIGKHHTNSPFWNAPVIVLSMKSAARKQFKFSYSHQLYELF